jgi:XRE family aerobic/anaerobic benzoate catabolism transcriptional regulator
MGMAGSGKTTLGARAAEALDMPFFELDGMIEKETGMPLAEVLSLYGLEGYRRLEADALEQVIKIDGPLILSVSGGLVEQDTPFARLLSRFHTIWLRTSMLEHVARAQGDLNLIKDESLAQIEARMDTQLPRYARAQAELDTSARAPQRSVRELLALIADKKFMDRN